jgi:hypothetical protein
MSSPFQNNMSYKQKIFNTQSITLKTHTPLPMMNIQTTHRRGIHTLRPKRIYFIALEVRDVAVKFPKWFHCKHTCLLTAYWGRSSSKYSPSIVMHLAQRCYHWWKHFWNSYRGIAFSAVVILFFGGGGHQLPEILVPLFLETARSHSDPNQGNRWVFKFSNRFLGHKLLGRERLVRGCIQKFPDLVVNGINNNKHSLRSNTKCYDGKTH